MGSARKNLDIIFRGIQPEMLFRSISDRRRPISPTSSLDVTHIDLDVFQTLAHAQYPTYSYEEIARIHGLMESRMAPVAESVSSSPSVFYLLVRMGKRVFRQNGDGLICKFSELLAWQNVYQRLGQDLFTTAFLAHEDLCCAHPCRTEFTWDAVLKTDNVQLNTILDRGIAENHCHLGGTTQNFPLSWACIMNHPQTIRSAAALIRENLQSNLTRGVSGNVWPWEQRLLWAAYLRIELFKLLEGLPGSPMNMEQACFYPLRNIKKELGYIIPCFAAHVLYKKDHRYAPDYALRAVDCRNGLNENYNRLLSGERSFLYRCFRACFDGSFDLDTQNWFFMYLLIKENFRAEIIQVNRQSGFHNFMQYQDRKDLIYDSIPGYQAEAVRLSVNGNQESQSILLFEARIAPKDSAKKMQQKIREYKDQISFAAEKNPPAASAAPAKYCFVYHFIKQPDRSGSPRYLMKPRNHSIRAHAQRSTKALAYALQHDSTFCNYVRGIDAANIEIGCRPETFAVEFRYLKELRPAWHSHTFCQQLPCPNLHITYHVGEDFLDLADGLRAIDEAVQFLHMERGDRIGHALALGVDPATHYRFKNQRSQLPKQDLLDNAVWLLYRSQELGILLSPQLRSALHTLADRYLSELYGPCLGSTPNLYEYFCSMQLRGDSPELYYAPSSRTPRYFLYGDYDFHKLDRREKLTSFRQIDAIWQLCHCYHFEPEIRRKGNETVEFRITDDYADLIRELQDRLAGELVKKGIMIECNPTSNYLIGTFGRYDAHPIFRFNNEGLRRCDGTCESSAQLIVSVNTDDSGVFDTSLTNEYAILAACLERAACNDAPKYMRDSIYTYLDHVREMGIMQSFLN